MGRRYKFTTLDFQERERECVFYAQSEPRERDGVVWVGSETKSKMEREREREREREIGRRKRRSVETEKRHIVVVTVRSRRDSQHQSGLCKQRIRELLRNCRIFC